MPDPVFKMGSDPDPVSTFDRVWIRSEFNDYSPSKIELFFAVVIDQSDNSVLKHQLY